MKASNTIVIEFSGIALDAGINAAFSFLKSRVGAFHLSPPSLGSLPPSGPTPPAAWVRAIRERAESVREEDKIRAARENTGPHEIPE